MTMCLPKKKTCSRCGRSFESTVDEQDECLSCMTKPLRRDMDDQQKQEVPAPPLHKTAKSFKEKTCTCGKIFIPTGPCQKRCRECIDYNVKAAATKSGPSAEQPEIT